MNKRTYRLRLASPAFLGDAHQRGVWRTPPLKALLREWWRVAAAPELGYDVSRLRSDEAVLFGTAADDTKAGSRQSQVRLALKHWNNGSLTDWSKANPAERGRPGGDPRVKHSEVQFGNGQVGSQLYLGYGPLVLDKGSPSPKLKNGAALNANEENTLLIAYPAPLSAAMDRAIALANWFGTIGGRGRNGWGSLVWASAEPEAALPSLRMQALEESGCLRPISGCLTVDWPHAIGTDGAGPLVWRSRLSFSSWQEAMKFLAQLKISYRIGLGFEGGQPHRKPQRRHLLAYPVTNHRVPDWEGAGKGRLANTLRFKLEGDQTGGLRALVYHTPCRPSLRYEADDVLDTWQSVHRHLDASSDLTRLD